MTEKICPSCGAKASEKAKFCGACGSSLAPKAKICTACGGVNDPLARYCVECGVAFAGVVSPLTAAEPSMPAKPPVEPIVSADPGSPPQSVPSPARPTNAAAPSAAQTKTSKTPSRKELSDNKLAAIAIWILCLIAIFIAIIKGGATHDQVMACTAAAGSGTGCPNGPVWGKIVWVLAVLGSGVGARLWSRR